MRGKPWHRRIEFRKKGFFVRNARPFVNVKSHFPPSEKRERKMVFPCSGPQFENCETTLRVAFLPFPVPLLAEECRRRHVSGSGQEKRVFGFLDGSLPHLRPKFLFNRSPKNIASAPLATEV